MAKFGFCGGSYQSQVVSAANQQSMNVYPEVLETIVVRGREQSRYCLLPTPGLSQFLDTGKANTRGQLRSNDRSFLVSGDTLYEVFSNGTTTNLGTVIDDGLPASLAVSQLHLVIASGGTVYVLTLATNAFVAIAAGTLTNVSQVVYCDSFFLALIKTSQTVRISAVLDGTSWPGGQVFAVSVFPDNVVSMTSDHREVWLIGDTKACAYQATGSAAIFDLVPGSLVEHGGEAIFGPVKMDNTIIFPGKDDTGARIIWRLDGYRPLRISTHAIEHALTGYSTIADACSYSYQDRGHSFFVLNLPVAKATWVYDVATGLWHERGFWNAGGGIFTEHLAWNHVYAFGKHLVGARTSGKLYHMADTYYDDAGSVLRHVRRSPHTGEAPGRRSFYARFELQMDPGILTLAGPTEAQLNLKWSNDSGKTWSNEYARKVGLLGQYSKRVVWNRLGSSVNSRIWEVNWSDAYPVRITDADLVMG